MEGCAEQWETIASQQREEIEALKAECEQLKSSLEAVEQGPEKPTTALPDMYAVRDRVLNEWRVGKRAESKQRLWQFANQLIEAIAAEDASYTFIDRLLSDVKQNRRFTEASGTTARTWEERYRRAEAELKRRGVKDW